MILDRTLKEHKPAPVVLQGKEGLQAPSLKPPKGFAGIWVQLLTKKDRVAGGGQNSKNRNEEASERPQPAEERRT